MSHSPTTATKKKRLPGPLRWLIYITIALALLVVGFYQFTRWSGNRAWENAVAAYEADGESMEIDDFLLDPIPDAENYASIATLRNIADPGTTGEIVRNPLLFETHIEDVRPPIWDTRSFASGPRFDLRAWDGYLNDSSGSSHEITAAKAVLYGLQPHYGSAFEESDAAVSRPFARWVPGVIEFYNREFPLGSDFAHHGPSIHFSSALALRSIA